MNKTSTIHFSVNNLASKSNGEIIDLNECFGSEKDKDDVCKVLNFLNYDAPQEVINSILDYASAKMK